MLPSNGYEIVKPDWEKIEKLIKALNLDPLIARILVNRGISNPDDARLFIHGNLDDMYDPFLIEDMDKAVSLILDHINQGNKILIHGDYDADGVTSTAIMIKSLSRIGGKLDFYIPDRFDEGYGFSTEAVQKAVELKVSLIITVDCGSSNHDIVNLAREQGIEVIITDHHEVPDPQPSAEAFINLKKPGETYPCKELSGAGVAFKVIQAIYKKLGRDDWKDFLDLAAVGSVADVIPLTSENRLIVKAGLNLLEKRKHPGISQLLEVSGVNRSNLSPWDISFIIATKINAAGRIHNAEFALRFLLEEDVETARQMAQRLVEMNEERQQIENLIKEEIEQKINENPEMLSKKAWVLSSRGWHQGVIGIVASRFSQSFKRPVFLISIDEVGVGRGSARCHDNYSVYAALEGAQEHLMHFGGHQLAGGFSIEETNISELETVVNQEKFFSHSFKPLRVDAELKPSQVNLETAQKLEILAPFGEGNPKPMFLSRRTKIQSISPVGKNEQHLKIWATFDGRDVKGIAFGMGSKISDISYEDLYYDLLYNLDVDLWNNQCEPSMKIQEILQPDRECYRIITGLDQVAISSDSEETGEEVQWRLIDARGVINRRKYIKELYRGRKDCLVLTRSRRQMEVITKNLKQEGINCVNLLKDKVSPDEFGAKIYISPYDHYDADIDFRELILYHPPYLWDHFVMDYFRAPGLRRVHTLFNYYDVMREESNQEMLAPEREKLLKIYKYLEKTGSFTSYVQIKPQQVARALKDNLIQAITIHLALKVFSEIGLLEFQNKKKEISFILKKNGKQDLENSPTYKNQLKKKEIFYQLKELYLKPSLDQFKENVLQVINSNEGG